MNPTDTPSILTDLAYRRDVLVGRMVVDGWKVTSRTELFLALCKTIEGDVPNSCTVANVLVPHMAPNLDTVEDFRGMLDKAEAAYNRGKQ